MCLVTTALRSKFLLLLSAFLGISNILVIINYKCAERSIKECTDHVNEKYETLSSDLNLKGLQIEINDTFQRFEEKELITGKAYIWAVQHGENRKQTQKSDKIKKGNLHFLPDCKQAPFLLMQIHSTPANFKEREAIRMSWGRPENRINKDNAGNQLRGTPRLWKTVFLLGQTNSTKLDKLLLNEARVYGDIVFGDFIDSYRNLTRKMELGIEWAAKHCKAQFVMKADEDSFVNIHELILWLKEYQRKHPNKPLYMGAALIDKGPFREPESQFYVSEEEYPESKYPPYAAGPGYVFSGKLLVKLSRALKVVRLFPNEDACFGALMQYIKVNLTNNERFIPFSMKKAAYWENEGYSLCKFNGPFVIHRISGKLQIQTHFNVLILKHVPTICEHVENGIGYTDYMTDEDLEFPLLI